MTLWKSQMHVIGIDLASRRYADIGVALLHRDNEHGLRAEFVSPEMAGLTGQPKVETLADWVELAIDAGRRLARRVYPQYSSPAAAKGAR